MDRWQNRVAVVTGASSGIGAACAKAIIGAGIQVVGLARRTERLTQLKESLPADQRNRFHYQTCDVCNEDQVTKVFKWIEEKLGGVDILINNAGILRDGNLVDMPMKEIRGIVETNLMAPIFCTQRAFESMKKRNFAGHLIFIDSTAGIPGFLPASTDPSLNMYTPSKMALKSVHEIFRQELINLKTKIKTTSINPGWVATEIVPEDTIEELGGIVLQAEDVANGVVYALSTPPHTQVQEITLRAVGEWH